MKVGRRFLVTFGIAVVLVGIVMLVKWFAGPVKVHVENQTGEPASNVVVSTRDEVQTRGTIPAFGKWNFTLHPKMDTGIDVQYRDQNGNSCGGAVDVYLDPGFRGTINIQVLGCHQLKFESNLGISLF
jgi:hypothetical protein